MNFFATLSKMWETWTLLLVAAMEVKKGDLLEPLVGGHSYTDLPPFFNLLIGCRERVIVEQAKVGQ